jgi:hypothetical protein
MNNYQSGRSVSGVIFAVIIIIVAIIVLVRVAKTAVSDFNNSTLEPLQADPGSTSDSEPSDAETFYNDPVTSSSGGSGEGQTAPASDPVPKLPEFAIGEALSLGNSEFSFYFPDSYKRVRSSRGNFVIGEEVYTGSYYELQAHNLYCTNSDYCDKFVQNSGFNVLAINRPVHEVKNLIPNTSWVSLPDVFQPSVFSETVYSEELGRWNYLVPVSDNRTIMFTMLYRGERAVDEIDDFEDFVSLSTQQKIRDQILDTIVVEDHLLTGIFDGHIYLFDNESEVCEDTDYEKLTVSIPIIGLRGQAAYIMNLLEELPSDFESDFNIFGAGSYKVEYVDVDSDGDIQVYIEGANQLTECGIFGIKNQTRRSLESISAVDDVEVFYNGQEL